MSATEILSMIASLASIILAGCAIFYAWQSERKSKENFDGARDLLGEIREKSAVIESAVSETQLKLTDAVIDAAKPRQSQEEIMMNTLLPMAREDPGGFRELMEAFQSQQPEQSNNRRPSRAERRRQSQSR